jgi:hypothetical protein
MSVPAALRYELWEDESGVSFFPASDITFRNLLSPTAKLIWSCEAESWEEAQSKKHQYLGWGPYVPHQ